MMMFEKFLENLAGVTASLRSVQKMMHRAAVPLAIIFASIGVHAAPPIMAKAAATAVTVSPRMEDAKTIRLSSGVLVAADIGHILQRGELVVAMTAIDAPPFFYMDGDKLKGTDVVIAEQIAAELKVKLRIDRSAKSFNEVVETVASGEADLGISKLSRTLTRAQSVFFTDPYLTLNHALILNRLEFAKLYQDKSPQWVFRNFTGTLGVIANSSFEGFAARNFPKAKLVTFTNWDSAIAAVTKGDIVAAYRDEFEIRRILKSDSRLALTLRTVTLKDLHDQLAIAVGVRSPTLLAFVNQLLSQRTEKLTVESVLAELK